MPYESFRAWQSRSIEQKQTASALMFATSGAALGFSVSLLDPQSGYIGCLGSWAFHIQAALHVISLAAAAGFSLNRVYDFDLTAQTARQREKNPEGTSLKSLRSKTRRLGRATKRLYFAQTVSFGLGAVAFLIFVLLHFRSALYL